MQPDSPRYHEARQWLLRSAEDVRAARHDLDATPPLVGDALFHRQQAVEKALKAFLAWHDQPFRRTHDLVDIGKQCVEIDGSQVGGEAAPIRCGLSPSIGWQQGVQLCLSRGSLGRKLCDTMNHRSTRRIRKLHWRADRIEHIARHSVLPEEVEEAVFGDPGGLLLRVGRAERNPEETLYRYFGRTEAGRHLLVVLLYVGESVAMPVTAREMTAKERRRFDDRRPESR